VGTAAPYNFNGLVRHYFLRREPTLRTFRSNLLPKGQRKAQSHDIAKRVRPDLTRIAARHQARVKVSEVPPGPPVLQTLVAEIYGPDYGVRSRSPGRSETFSKKTEGVVDADWYVEDDQTKFVSK